MESSTGARDRPFMKAWSPNPSKVCPFSRPQRIRDAKIATVTKLYDSTYMLMFKKTCRRKPKDMRPILLPLKSQGAVTIPETLIGEKGDENAPAEILRNVRILLNKLSRANFARVCDSLLNSFAYTQEILQELARLLFNKCVKEPNYIDLYMELVDHLVLKFKASSTSKPEENGLNFKKLFLTLCQSKLENPENDLLINATLQNDEAAVLTKKERLVGNVKLVAELFTRGMAPDVFVKKCLDKLLAKDMEDNVETAIRLLEGIGKKMYEFFSAAAVATTSTASPGPKKSKLWIKTLTKEHFDAYLDKLVALKMTDKIGSRVKFMIGDLIKARDEVWSQSFAATAPKSSKAAEKGESHKTSEPDLTETATKLEEQEKRKKSINESNVLGKNLDRYHKAYLEAKLRLKIYNVVDEFLASTSVSEAKENIREIVGLSKGIIAGHMMLHAFGKKPAEFVAISGLVKRLTKDAVFAAENPEEAVLVVLANYYDLLIDTPAAMEQFKGMVTEWEQAKMITKELETKAVAHAETIKKQLDEEYQPKGK